MWKSDDEAGFVKIQQNHSDAPAWAGALLILYPGFDQPSRQSLGALFMKTSAAWILPS